MDQNGLTYHYMEGDKLKYSSVEPAVRFESDCDLKALWDVYPAIFLQTTVRVYADASLAGDPFCTIAPGPIVMDYAWIWPSQKGDPNALWIQIAKVRDTPNSLSVDLLRAFISSSV